MQHDGWYYQIESEGRRKGTLEIRIVSSFVARRKSTTGLPVRWVVRSMIRREPKVLRLLLDRQRIGADFLSDLNDN
jgi:hypothetical protein